MPVLRSEEVDGEEGRAALRNVMSATHHTDLLNAVLDRNVDQALLLMAEHAGTTMDVFERTSAVQAKLARKLSQQAQEAATAKPAKKVAKAPAAKTVKVAKVVKATKVTKALKK